MGSAVFFSSLRGFRLLVQDVQAVQNVQIVQTPSFILPRDAGEEEVGARTERIIRTA